MKRLFASMWMLACVAAAPAEQDREAKELATFGVAAQAPEGWARMWEGRANTIARWSNAVEGRRATAVITLELEAASGRTLAQHAEALKQKLRNGQIGIHALVMGGQPAMLITGRDAEGNAAIYRLVALNDKYFYALTGYAAVPGLVPGAAIDQMARAMRFVPITDPARATDLREPITYFDRFTIALLRTMRPAPEPAPARTAYLMAFDHRTHQAALSAEIQVMRNHHRTPLLALGRQLTRRMSPAAEVQWGATPTQPLRAISRPFTLAHPDGRKIHTRLGLVQLGDEEFVYLNFTIGAADDADSRAALEAACEKIVMSLTPIAK